VDFTKAIEIAKDIFWVGYVIPNDPFQCHVYLIKNGKESVLIDPGSMITFPITMQKISSILPINDIKYVILHHQDPDIVGCVSTLEALMPRKDKCFITHWRAETLLKHYQWETPFWLVDQHDWKLTLEGGRELEFVFTPYAHFAGAFCTYDKQTGTLFSSDIFGGLTDEFSLYAKDESYFESLKLFHIHYMPSKAILNHTLEQIEKKEPKLIAPQHGSIIEKDLIKPIISKMKDLDCGLYMLDNQESNIYLLNKADELLKKFFEDIISLASFELVLRNLFDYINKDIPNLENILVYKKNNEKYLLFYDINQDRVKHETDETVDKKDKSLYEKPLIHGDKKIGKLEFIFSNLKNEEEKLINIFLNKIIIPFSLSFLKNINFEVLEEKAKTDSLTGLHNREYMQDILSTAILESKNTQRELTLAMIDIDFFKKVNDTYGHIYGDCILKSLSKIILEYLRKDDIVIRFGGEEILIIMPKTRIDDASKKIDTLRKNIEKHEFCEECKLNITISAGLYQYNGENSMEFVEKADKRLYKAKEKGRNRVIWED
jgi:diguanylate cyclase (GGDEF)-like protein